MVFKKGENMKQLFLIILALIFLGSINAEAKGGSHGHGGHGHKSSGSSHGWKHKKEV